MYAFAAALPPVAILVLAAGSLALRRRHRPKAPLERDAVDKKLSQTVPEVAKLKAKKTRKRSKRSSQPTNVENGDDELEARGETQQPELQLRSEQEAPLEMTDMPSSSSGTISGDSTGLWTTVMRKSRTSRASVARAEAQADATAKTTAASTLLISDAAPSSSLVHPVHRPQSSTASSAEEASARAQAKWFTTEEMHPGSQSQSSQPTPKPHSEDAQCAKEGHAKRRCSACLQQGVVASGRVAPLQKSQTGKNWAAVTADTPDEQVATVRDLASFPLFNRASEFGAVGDRVISYHAVKAKVDTGNVRFSSDSDASETLAKRSMESADSTFSSPRSMGSLSPRSQSSTLDGMSDEDEHAGKSSAAELEYVARQNLSGPKDPVNELKTLPERLDSSDWLEVADALNNLRALVFFHAASSESVMPSVAPQILKAMKNPRSALQKTAIMALTDAFSSLGDKTLPWISLLLLELFLKASQDKKFVCETADEALRVMVASVSPAPLLEKLLPFTNHKSQRVRAKAIAAIYSSLIRMNVDEMVAFGPERLVKAAKRLQTDKQPEARDAARKMLEVLESQGKVAPVVEC
ncbi:hypothetical protein KFL_001540110 [Klebsormidium nitens]|uniref:TOG domain-containing protein n=1 Tax=Klebsormidium nitens TaxID=105231 RepID=A0A1Y1HZI3_KLENI|nr:hypothetical protein KFL_001540110 [Klebsormidium nitens]|eukprot:GAQ83593.1 hypothetical protein KFL_001540110 [Klebsormidium nitens]